jgi:(1->4)-alpha-D-glucan 1-alpha-D-glucosylmutase
LREWPLYVVVEKILTGDETLSADWPTYGTSGYEFLNLVNGLFVDTRHADTLTHFYRDWTQDDTPFVEVAYQRKRLILGIALASELHMLSLQLDRLAQRNRWSRDLTLNTLRQALREVIACFPVYRPYITGLPIRPADQQQVRKAIRRSLVRNPAQSKALFSFVHDTLLLKSPRPVGPEYVYEQRRFVGKFQQVTAPVMAKGVEDTAFYVYHRLLSLNEVGGDPTRFGTPVAVFHQTLQERQEKWPWAFSTMSTHDTKRSEDVRARLNVLSEIPGEWQECMTRWSKLNDPHKPVLEEGPAPDRNEEYLLYQTLVGVWPLEPLADPAYAQFVERIHAYMRKALHEAKVHSSWINPNDDYDAAMQQFIDRILDPAISGEFLADVRAFHKRVNHYGLLNSLGQKVVQLTSPGVVDIYQGNELWDFSLVDPDNRRPVDYAHRQQMLNELRNKTAAARGDLRALARALTAQREDGRIKMYVTWRGLLCRREHKGLFTAGTYVPVDPTGAKAEHVVSFLREGQSAAALVAVPRLLTRLLPWLDQAPYGPAIWADTALRLPAKAGTRWRNIFTGAEVVGRALGKDVELPMAHVCGDFPVAVLLREG